MTNLIENIADRVPGWGAKLAYGEKTTLDGRDLLPVALVVFGFGAGEGSGDKPADESGPAGSGEGQGGGGGGYAIPVGAYVADAEGIRFRANPIAVMAVAVPLVWAAGWALSRALR